MCLGFGACAEKIAEDDYSVLYIYGGINWNDKRYVNENHVMDGTIEIPKECIPEAETHNKLKKMASGRKKLINKRIGVSSDYRQNFMDGVIQITESSNSWRKLEDCGMDIAASWIIWKVIDEYQDKGVLPEGVYYFK